MVKEAKTMEVKRLNKKVTTMNKKKSNNESVNENEYNDLQTSLNNVKNFNDGLIVIQYVFFMKLHKFNKGSLDNRSELIDAFNSLDINYPDVINENNTLIKSKIGARFMSIDKVNQVCKSSVESVCSTLGESSQQNESESKENSDSSESVNRNISKDESENTSKIKSDSENDKNVNNKSLISKLSAALGGSVKDGSEDDNENEDESDNESQDSGPVDGYTSGELSDENEELLENWPDPDTQDHGSDEGKIKDDDNNNDNNDDVDNMAIDSLNTGFGYISGGSEEPLSDVEEKPQRKNRRSQRARRAIWEKKYGKNANHVKKRKEEEKAERDAKIFNKGKRDGGWKGRQQENNNKRDNNRRFDNNNKNNHKFSYDNNNNNSNDKKQPPQHKKLHPSWEAKRLQKEKEAQQALPAAQPTKIVFDD